MWQRGLNWGKVVHGVLSNRLKVWWKLAEGDAQNLVLHISKFQILVMVSVLGISTWSLGEKNLFNKVFFLNGKKVYSSASLLFERICLSLPFRDKFCLKRDWMVGKSQKVAKMAKKWQKYQILFTNVAKRPEAAYVVISKRHIVWRKLWLDEVGGR